MVMLRFVQLQMDRGHSNTHANEMPLFNQATLETNNPENLLKKLGGSWVDLRSEVKEGEFCKLSGTKFVADNVLFRFDVYSL